MAQKTAADIMQHEVLTVEPGTPIQQVAEFLIAEGISGAPVVDDEGSIIGVVSLTDIAIHEAMPEREGPRESRATYFRLAEESGLTDSELLNFRLDDLAGAATAADIMTAAVYEVQEDTPAEDVAGMMLTSEIHRVIVTRDEKLVGIVSSMDLLQLLV